MLVVAGCPAVILCTASFVVVDGFWVVSGNGEVDEISGGIIVTMSSNMIVRQLEQYTQSATHVQIA